MAQSNKPPKSKRRTEQSGKGGPFIKKATLGRPVGVQSPGPPTHPRLSSRDKKSSRSSSDVKKPQDGLPVEGIGVSPAGVQPFPEMQNEELCRTRLELEVARDRYAVFSGGDGFPECQE
ncbi:MAG TPA: hypothetical protein PKM72_11180 [Nitrospirales bacterium]|nr:hypothetical protein [Nitrospirales bacterium]